MISTPTFWANIYAGQRVGYTDKIYGIDKVIEIVDAYCNRVELCVTITPTQFRYVGGWDPGVVVGLINYPRFLSSPAEVRVHALELAELLRVGLEQNRISVVMPGKTVMLGDP